MSDPATSTKPAAAAASEAAAEPVPATPAMSELEASLAAYSAANPVDGRKLAEQIVKLQKQYESTKKRATSLEQLARVDKDVLRNQLQQLLSHLSPEMTKQYCMQDIDQQVLSDKGEIARDGFKRVIAACNATFMQSARPEVSKRAAEPVDEPAEPKRTRTAEPVAEPVAAPSVAVDVDDSEMLRRALSAVYN